jgi:hypothetical protein
MLLAIVLAIMAAAFWTLWKAERAILAACRPTPPPITFKGWQVRSIFGLPGTVLRPVNPGRYGTDGERWFWRVLIVAGMFYLFALITWTNL